MKQTLAQCKQQIAERNGFKDWKNLLDNQNNDTFKNYYIDALEMFSSQFNEYYQ